MNLSHVSLDAFRVIDAIERRGTFAGAAEELHRVTSAISYTVQKLEQEIGFAIFDRSGKRARFTQAGQLLLQSGRQILAATEASIEEASAVASGWESKLTIALDAIYPVKRLLPWVNSFYHLQASTQIVIRSEVLAGLWEAFESERVDIAIGPAFIQLGSDVKTIEYEEMNFIYVAAPNHAVFQQAPNSRDELTQHRIIVVADSARNSAPLTFRVGRTQPTLTVTNFEAKCDALVAGLGVGSLPEDYALPLITQNKLKQIASMPKEPAQKVIIAWREGGQAKQWFVERLSGELN